jgi:DNA-binding protein H-NS
MTQAEYQIPDLPLEDLELMRRSIDSRISEKRNAARQDAALTLARTAQSLGFSMRELIPLLKDEADMPVKYRHPDHPELTWCGKGRRPLWVNEAIDKGITLAELRVDQEGSGSC